MDMAHDHLKIISEEVPSYAYAEVGVLGGLVLENERWDSVVQLLAADDFYFPAHRIIFQAIAELSEKNCPFDLITLTDRLTQRGQIDRACGFAYVAEVCKNTPSAANIEEYARIVAEKSRLRQLLALGKSLSADVFQPNIQSDTLIEQAESQLFNLAEKGSARQHQEMTLLQGADSLIAHLERIQGSQGITGTPTGFQDLDEKTCGLQAGDLILLAARPSMGKTALGLAFCLGALRHRDDAVVQIFSLEMPTVQLMLRLTAMEGGVSLSALRSGMLDDEQWGRISQSLDQFARWDQRLVIDDCSHQTPTLLRARARRYTRKYGKPVLIMVDYLQLMCAPGQENRTQEIADISRNLKALGKELGCPVLALSQLNRQVESRADKRPNNGDLRDSGSLEQDADLILHLYRDEVYHPDTPDTGIAEIIIGKQRQGPTGTLRVRFDGQYTRFSNLSADSDGYGG
ncbi:SPI-7-type island replicative DNA helicase [Xenorhabdus bovienii]|uniref:SPI-7-type island replicative DNA helicase n=1 Tax=Xenorhabdus bovienii TaxID=40576 RepID=UPI0023B2BE8E|nr:SPI-7-type island replicative DNA helicase [Xenorhabdus bovienii]MDE9433508.1 replicative DNA helicase [Xenorhabdus bovienii]MDE9491148.1 replicative DNA helicase [Xenorhabdus bovienii]MDE9507466.1 replicative DNA helicase [Xenorhabdus bovienii]